MKPLSKQTLIGIILIILILLAIMVVGFLGVGNRSQESHNKVENEKVTNNQKEISESDPKNPGKDLLTLHEDGIDISEWKTYRNEEYGFEFELPKEYFLPENDKNVIRKQDTINILDPNKDIYLFNSKKGLEIVKEFGGLGDATDYWMVKVDIHEYTSIFSTDFKQWIFDTYNADETDVQDVGLVKIGDREVPYFCWVSFLGDDCGAYFTNKQSVVEFKAWDLASENNKINFNYEVLKTIRYWEF